MVPEDTELIAYIAPKPDAYKGDVPFTHLGLTGRETITSHPGKTALSGFCCVASHAGFHEERTRVA